MKHFFKRITALTVSGILTLSLCANAFAIGTLDHFKTVRTYENQFSDIGGWYEKHVIKGYELGLFDGKDDGAFSPNANMTFGEAVKLAACMHSIYHDGNTEWVQSNPWWKTYESYCLKNGILDKAYPDYNRAISRAEFAQLFSRALPEEALSPFNPVSDGAIPDVQLSDAYGPAVYQLYRAGILTGSDQNGSFFPNANIRRSEMAAIVSRMVHTASRQAVILGQKEDTPLTAEQLFAKCSPAVFLMETFDEEGESLGFGSGIFLSGDGEAVSSWHVLDGADSATITTVNGETYPVCGIYDYDVENDLIRLQIDGSGFTPMTVNYSGALYTGAQIYTIGNPLGLEHTLSTGIISAVQRTINGAAYIQFTAPISSGSSGGALINDRGELIGITSASIVNGQSLNLATPITKTLSLSHSGNLGVAEMSKEFYDHLASGFTLSETELTLDKNERTVITCSVPGIPSGYSASYEIADAGIVQCSWGKWAKETEKKDTVDLTVTAKNSGKTEIKINLRNRQGAVLATQVIKVTVSEMQAPEEELPTDVPKEPSEENSSATE